MFQVKLDESNSTRRRIPVLLVDATDGYTPETGLSTFTVNVSQNGTILGSQTQTLTEVGNGIYYYTLGTGAVNTLGWVTVNVSATGCRQYNAIVQIMAYDAMDVVRLGLTAIPNAPQGTAGSLPTANASGAVTVVTNNDKTGYSLSSGSITSSTFGTDAITASALAADAAEEIANTVWQADNDTKYGGGQYDVDSLGRTILRSSNTQAEVDVNGNNHVSAVVHQMQSNVVTAGALDATAITEIAQGVLTEATSTDTAVYAAGDVGNVLGRLHNMIAADGADFQYTANALELAPSGGGGGGGWALNTDQTTGLKRMISAIVGVGGETATPGVLEFDMVGETTTLRITQSTDGNDRLTVEEV